MVLFSKGLASVGTERLIYIRRHSSLHIAVGNIYNNVVCLAFLWLYELVRNYIFYLANSILSKNMPA
jgi:hypothetical protein